MAEQKRGSMKYVNGQDVFQAPNQPPVVGNPLLHKLMARTWREVTGGKGVVLVDGKPVTDTDAKGGTDEPA